MTATAFAHADVLRRIGDDQPIPTIDAFAAEFDRDPSNFRKTLKALEGEGLIVRPQGERPALTDLGRQVLAGVDVAQGRAAPAGAVAPTRWPLDKIRPNPANRTIDPSSIRDLADSIVGIGDIIQPLTLTPVDANGVRMILAGERRWRAVLHIANRDAEEHNEEVLNGGHVLMVPSLPAALEAGVPFVEREATDAEALLITVVENTAREDLTPLDDALLLLQLAEATGWSGAEVARRTGRQSETKKNGAKDVQDKLKIAREATPDAIAEYRRTGSWDDLRNSVRDRKPVDTDPDQLPMFEADADPARALTVADFGVPKDWHASDVSAAAEWLEPGSVEVLDFRPSRGGIYPTASVQVGQIKGGLGWLAGSKSQTNISGHSSSLNGVWGAWMLAYRTREEAMRAAVERIVGSVGDRMTSELRKWLDAPVSAPSGPHVVNGVDYLNATRANDARRAAGIIPTAQPNSGASAKPAVEESREPSPRGRMVLLELAYKIDAFPTRILDAGDAEWGDDIFANYRAFGAQSGAYWKDATFSELDKLGLIKVVHKAGGRPPIVQLTDQGVAWFAVSLVGIPPSAAEVITARREAMEPEGTPFSGLVTEWLEHEAQAAPASTHTPVDLAPDDDAEDDPTQATPDDIALLGEALTLYHNPEEEPDEDAARSLMARLNVTGPFTEDGDGGLIALIDGKAEALAFFDVDRVMPDERSRAIALLVAWACQVVFGGDDATALETIDLATVSAPDRPAVPIRKSIQPDFLVCLEDGRRFKSLKRHLRTKYDLSPEDYIARWGLPSDYPMQAPNYARARAELAAQMGLGGGQGQ